MDIVNIYGNIPDKSEIILGIGNYNNVHGLLTYFPHDDLLQMRSLSEIITPSVLPLIINYEKPSSVTDDDKIYFTLSLKDTDRYINVKIDVDAGQKVACACVSKYKAYFSIDHSVIDRKPRSQLLSGSLYSLETILGEKNYIVSWKINGFANGDLIMFLPTTWYESSDSSCQEKAGIISLVESLQQLSFKGYTTQAWCDEAAHVINCVDNNLCGDCMGPCNDSNHICYPNPDMNGSIKYKFICGYPQSENKLDQTSMVSFTDSTEQQPAASGTTATWIAIIVIVIIVSLLTWGLSRKNK